MQNPCFGWTPRVKMMPRRAAAQLKDEMRWTRVLIDCRPLLPVPGETLPPFCKKIQLFGKIFRNWFLKSKLGSKTRYLLIFFNLNSCTVEKNNSPSSWICEKSTYIFTCQSGKQIFFYYFCENLIAVLLSVSSAIKIILLLLSKIAEFSAIWQQCNVG